MGEGSQYLSHPLQLVGGKLIGAGYGVDEPTQHHLYHLQHSVPFQEFLETKWVLLLLIILVIWRAKDHVNAMK